MPPTSDNDLQYYLYMSDDWRGPYPLPQIRSFLKLGQIDETTYAYEPQHQSQLTVSDLLAGRKVMPAVMGNQAASGYGSSGSHSAVDAQAAHSETNGAGQLDAAINALGVMRRVCFSIAGTDGRNRDDLLDDLKAAVDTIRAVLRDLRGSPAELRNFAVHIDRIANDVAARMSDKALTAHLVDMRDCITHADPDEIVPAAEAVIGQIAHLARTAGDENPFEIVDDDAGQDQPLDAYESARFELKGLQTDLSSVKEAYAKLQEAYAKEQKQARKIVVQLKEQLESEQKAHEGDNAELRALAAEIHDLAGGCGVAEEDPAVARDLIRLAEELQHTQPLSLVPVAESVLNRMVSRLSSGHSEVREQVRELTTVRAELLQLKTDMSMLRQREEQLLADKSRLQKQLDEERGAASRVDQNARAREAQLKSTIAALQVTKELHQEVMGDLQEQLRGAQHRVEAMESELVSTRNELKGTRTTFESREMALVAELDQLSRTRHELEQKQNDLSGSLQSAERELAQARERVAQSDEDESLAEALAAKVNELRSSFEQTRQRLREQEGNAGALQRELADARTEAAELRSRSDQMANELDSARGNLEAARRRMDELQRAAARLEAERSALQGELSERKGTDTIVRDAEGGHLRSVIADLEGQVGGAQTRIRDLEAALDAERARAAALATAHGAADAEHADHAAERERLRGEISALRASGAGEARIFELEERLGATERNLRDTGEARSDLQAKLAAVASERDRLNGELIRLRTEFEASAVEHRAAIAAARKGQTEAAMRAAELKTQLDAAEAERTRLGGEVEVQRQAIADGHDTESRLGALGERLAEETARADRLARDLEGSRRDYAAAQVKLERLRTDLLEAEQERDRLDNEIARRHDMSSVRDAVDADGRTRLQEALDRLREQLDREQRRSADLERRLEAARGDARSAATRHAETAGSYADAVGRADRLAGEIADERARHAAELVEAERRLGIERERARGLEVRLGEIDGRLSAATARQAGLERTVTDLNAERERLQRDLGEARQARGDADKRQTELTARLRSTEGDLADLRAEIALTAEQREAVSTELASTTGRHSRLAVTVERLTSELAQARSQLDAVHAEHDAALQAVKAQLDVERNTITALQNRIATAERDRDGAVQRASGLEQRLQTADSERTALFADAERLRQEIARTASALRPEDDPAAIVALRTRLADVEAQLDRARNDLDSTAQRGADRLLELEERLAAEQAKAKELDALRERLRLEAVQHAEARTALAAVTAARDALTADLERLRGELERLKTTASQDRQAGDRLVLLEGQLGSERDKVSRLEADLAIARSREQVAIAGREGLENTLSKVVSDRERLLAEVDQLRGELDQLRLQMRGAGPEQQAEIAALKHMLTLERTRVQQLEERLAEAWRKQGETQALTDGELRRRLEQATARIDKLKSRLRAQRRKTEELQTRIESTRSNSPASADAEGSSSFTRPGLHAGFEANEFGEQSAAGHAAITRETALEPGRRSSGARTAVGQGSAPRDLEAGGFISAFGRPAIGAATPRSNDLAPVLATISQTRGSTLLHRRHRHLLLIAGIAIGACLVVAMLSLMVGAMFVPCGQAVINARAETAMATQDGRLDTVLRVAGDQVTQGEDIATIDGRERIRNAIAAQNKSVEQTAADLESAGQRAQRLETDLAALEDRIVRERARQLTPIERRRDERWTRIDQVARQITELTLATAAAAPAVNEMPVEGAAANAGAEANKAAALVSARSELERLQAEDDLDRKRLEDLHRQFDIDPTMSSLNGKLSRLKVENARAQSDVTALRSLAETQRARLTELETALADAVNLPVTAPIDGTIVKWLVDSDRVVTNGMPLAQLASPEAVFVEALVPEGRENAVMPGDRAELELLIDGRRLHGTVRTLLAPGQGVEAGTYIHPPGVLRDRRHRVVIALDPGSLHALSQGARVIVVGREPGLIRRGLLRIYAMTL